MIDASVRTWDEAGAGFRWNVPEHFNIAHAVCDRHADRRDQVALYYENESGDKATYTFGDIKRLSDRFANVLRGLQIQRGDRVAIVLSQRPETAIAHMAIYKIGAIALPLSILFGSDAIDYRLRDSGAKLVITDCTHRDRVDSLTADIPELETVIDCDAEDAAGFWELLHRASDSAHVVDTRADDPALLIYTSGTTGPPKGALVAHRCLYGNLTGFELSQNLFPQPDDLFWTPADWAWTGGLIDGLLVSWYYGVPIVGYAGGKFDPEFACDLMSRYRVRNAFIPPTALKMIRQVDRIRERYDVCLRSVMSAGEAVGAELFQWGREVLGLEINEMWGQSEANYLVGNCSALMEVQPGSMGKPYPDRK
ncbi:MAG: AMP-binding protein, partial [Gammaproteobacteria bacterium]|nr:AMP-binding protein [Gammaproteobacteria bacterium]